MKKLNLKNKTNFPTVIKGTAADSHERLCGSRKYHRWQSGGKKSVAPAESPHAVVAGEARLDCAGYAIDGRLGDEFSGA